jgi:vancomycin resistance protein YoaR
VSSDYYVYGPRRAERRRSRLRTIGLPLVGVAFAVGAVALVVGTAMAGTPTQIAAGTTIGGVDVGGLTAAQAARRLHARSAAVEAVPVSFRAGDQTFSIAASQLGVRPRWDAAVREAIARGDGIAPLRGLRRLQIRFAGTDVAPPVSVYSSALAYQLDLLAARIKQPSVDASLRRKGLTISVVPERMGHALDRAAASALIVSSLAALDRGATVVLPERVEKPRVDASMLTGALRQARTAVSAPARLVYGETAWRLPRWRIATLLTLPKGGDTTIALGGKAAERYLAQLSTRVGRPPADARFVVTSGGVRIAPSRPGLSLDTSATAKALTAALVRPNGREATLVVRTAQPERTTAAAKAMGITGVVASYTTSYGGTPGRLHNVQLVAQLIDGALVKPGAVFSFNGTTGERTADKGFEEAPVIINGELQNGLGGGVCQVSTTVFNAAFDAGLPIVERTNHALYISHYPQGRDATVDYPSLDLKFRNDTGKWLLIRTFVGSGSLTVNLYGTAVDRRVEVTTGPLVTTGAAPVKKIDDPTLAKGKTAVETYGAPPRSTSVRRIVYTPSGEVLYDTTFGSRYVGEPTIMRVGTKKKPPKKQAEANADAGTKQGGTAQPAETSTTPATTPRP